MARTLWRRGASVTILEWDRDAQLPSEVSEDGEFKVYRLRLPAAIGLRAILKYPLWLSYLFVFLLRNRFSAIQVQNFDNLLIPLMLRPFLRYRIVYDLADFYSDGYLPNSGVPARIIARMERLTIRRVDALIMVSERQEVQTGPDNLPRNRAVVYNVPDEQELAEVEVATEETRAPLGSQLSLFYGGVLARDRVVALLNLSRAMLGLETIELKVAGFGQYAESFRQKVQGMRNVHYLGALSHSGVLDETARGDCVVLPYDSSLLNNAIALPNKLCEALALSKPLIVQKDTYMAKVVAELNAGFVTDFRDIETLRQTLVEMAQHREILRIMGSRGRKAFEEKYRWLLMEDRLTKLYRELSPGRSAA
jgi:Glycosyl transferase 4-like domain/Glycosyl transferases group 1